MSNQAFFEVFVEGDDEFIIDTSKYVQGRSGRHLPKTITFSLLGYRYRPATPVCALFPPRLIVSCQNSFSTAGQVVVNEVGSRRHGASVSLIARTADSASQCVDSAACGFPFVINVSDSDGGFPSSIVISIADGSIQANTIALDANRDPIASPTDATLKTLMNNALLGGKYGTLNAIALPVALGASFFAPSTLTGTEQIFGVGSHEATMLTVSAHSYHPLASMLSKPSPEAAGLVSSPSLYILRTSSATSPDWRTGFLAYAVVLGGQNNTWVSDLFQQGASLSFFYRASIAPGTDPVIQRFDFYVGAPVANPPDRIVAPSYTGFFTVFQIYTLPNTDPPVLPTTDTSSLITNVVVLPITRRERSAFGGTFNLSFDY